ncbi:TPA: 3-deoxy-manno-octulosonate cytidylyltransferase [Neisseria meningitidis]
MQQHIEKWQHLSREEQKILAEVWGLVQNDDQEVHYEMLKLNAPDEASGEFWFRMAETLSTLPPNRSLDLRMNGGRLATAVSILSVMIEDNPDIPQLWAQKITALNYSGLNLNQYGVASHLYCLRLRRLVLIFVNPLYLAHGHKARADGLAQQPDKAAEANEEEYLTKALSQNLLSTLDVALARFPEDAWFQEIKQDAQKHFA